MLSGSYRIRIRETTDRSKIALDNFKDITKIAFPENNPRVFLNNTIMHHSRDLMLPVLGPSMVKSEVIVRHDDEILLAKCTSDRGEMKSKTEIFF